MLGLPGAPFKTAEGQEEIATRARRLGQRQRTVLLLVDGRRSQAEVKALAAQVGVAPEVYDELLAIGLIAEPVSTVMPALPLAEVDLALPVDDEPPPAPAEPVFAVESTLLPAARTLQPETSINGELGPPLSVYPDEPSEDDALEEARALLSRALRSEAPVAGSLTLLRLRRVRRRADLAALLGEIEQRIRKPHRVLATQVLMQRVRALIGVPQPSR